MVIRCNVVDLGSQEIADLIQRQGKLRLIGLYPILDINRSGVLKWRFHITKYKNNVVFVAAMGK